MKCATTFVLMLLLATSASTQNVGIGVLAPSEKLHINGNLRLESKSPVVEFFANPTGNSGLDFFTGSIHQGSIWFDGQNEILRFAADTGKTHMSITDVGTVGIGVTSSGPRLQIKGFGTGSGTTLDVINGASATLLHVQDNGFVGLGTTSPTSRLHISATQAGVLKLESTTNPLVSFYNNGIYDGYIQAFNGDFYFGKSGNGDIVLANPGVALRIKPQGAVIIGVGSTPASGYKLSVDGKVVCEEVLVKDSESWPDYVFSADYHLADLDDLEAYIYTHCRLPNIPSAEAIDTDGIEVAAMQKLMMQKIEELTLYVIQLKKEIDALKQP